MLRRFFPVTLTLLLVLVLGSMTTIAHGTENGPAWDAAAVYLSSLCASLTPGPGHVGPASFCPASAARCAGAFLRDIKIPVCRYAAPFGSLSLCETNGLRPPPDWDNWKLCSTGTTPH